MPPIVAIVGTKGGTGKSTVAMGVAAELHQRGYRLQLVDGDERQRTTSKWSDVAAERARPCVQVVCVGEALPTQLPAMAQSRDVELVILDMPCRLEARTENVLHHCDYALVPCGPSAPELWELATTLDQIRKVQRTKPKLRAAVVINGKIPRTVMAREARATLTGDPELQSRGIPVLASELHRVAPHAYAWAAGVGVTQWDPRSGAAAETRALVDELVRVLGLRRSRKGKR